MEIASTFNAIPAARARDNLGVTAELDKKLNKTGGELTGAVQVGRSSGSMRANNAASGMEFRSGVDANGRASTDVTAVFHLPGQYITQFGLDRTTNEFGFGAGTEGANFYRLWTAKNFDPATKFNVNGSMRMTGILGLKATSGGMATSAGGLGSLEVLSAGTSSDAAFITFHRAGQFATYFGLGNDNKFKIGGWSHGDIAYDVLHTGLFNPADQGFGNNQVRIKSIYDASANDGRIQIDRGTQTNNAFADVYLNKDTRSIAAAGAGVTTQFRVNADVGANNAHIYQILTTMKLDVAGNSAHQVGMYSQIWKTVDAPTWTFCTELRDKRASPTKASIGAEIGIFGTGADPNNCRFGIDLVYGSGEPYQAGDNVITTGMRIQPYFGQTDWTPSSNNPESGGSTTTGRCILKYGIQINGNVGTGIDLSGCKPSYSNTAILLADNHRIKWTSGAELGFFGNAMIINPPSGGLIGGSSISYADAYILANVAGYGDCKIPVVRR